jgi:hypothetical protein
MRSNSSPHAFGGFMVALALLAALTATPGATFAAEPATPSPEAAKRFATVWKLRGEVAASPTEGSGGKERKLRVGDAVYVGDNVRSSQQGEVVLKTEDAGVVAVRPKTEFVATRFSAEDKPTDGLVVRLLSGSLRMISGWVAHTNRGGNTVQTPTATVGIRGTDHETYVLSPELALATSNKEGTYDKVNRGGTTLAVEDGAVDIEPGKVGFVRAAKKNGMKERGLLTLLLPVLLDRVPSFFVPGEFDAELDRYSQTADQEGLRLLEQKRKGGANVAQVAAPVVAVAPVATTAAPVDCNAGATAIAKTWIAQFDRAITRKDAKAVVALFANDATVHATVRTADGKTASVDLDRDELAESSIAALKGLKDYQQRRVTIEGKPANAAGSSACTRVAVRSEAMEQGVQSGKPYRFESLEEYVLELQGGKWLAIKAETTQK